MAAETTASGKTNRQINHHLARFSRHFRLNTQDEEDLRQEILCEILIREVDYDPARSSPATYRERIIQKRLARFRSSKRWQKHRPPKSIHDLDETEEPRTNDVSSYELDDIQNKVFVSELQDVIDGLPDMLPRCCELLKTRSLKETAQILGVSLAAVHRMTREIKEFFTAAGFGPQA